MRARLLLWWVTPFLLVAPCVSAQSAPSEQVQVSSPVLRRAEAPSPNASAAELEARGDELRAQKAFLDAVDYYRAALAKNGPPSAIYNKMGIAELQMQRYKEARKNFERSIKGDRKNADAYNNLGAVLYEEKKYGAAIKHYDKAIELNASTATFYCNLGAAYFSKKEFDRAAINYARALQLDPEVFERHSRTGISAQLPSPEDRAHYAYVMAKLYAKAGNTDKSLEYLKRAMEGGYKGIEDVYKDPEFAAVRTDARFQQLMAARPPAIPD